MSINISELFIFGFDGFSLPNHIKTYIKNNSPGSLILFKRNIESLGQIISLNSEIINANFENPPLISVDQEGGRVARLRGICTDIPPLGKITNNLLENNNAYKLGALQGRELLALGFNLNFAPICDIFEKSDDSIIGDRSFSKEPKIVAKLAYDYIKGLQDMGVIACSKHFPGHGATTIDSHFHLPVVENLPKSHLLPFKAAIKANVETMMTAHVIYKDLDSLPAMMSENIIQNLLRKELLFDGIIISDDLEMKAICDNYDLKEVLEKSLYIGVDMYIIGKDFEKVLMCIEIIQNLINKNSKLKENALKSINKIKNLKKRFQGAISLPDLEYAQKIVRCKPHLSFIEGFNI